MRDSISAGLRGSAAESLLWVDQLEKTYGGSHRRLRPRGRVHEVRAVDGVSFDVRRGEAFGLVGESGSGKSTIARCIVRLVEPSAGKVFIDGVDLLRLRAKELRRRRRHAQIVFQDPSSSLDSRMTIRASLEEPLLIHRLGDRPLRAKRVEEVLEDVGLPTSLMLRKPHALSGGQQQRVAIARALTLRPDLIILDEPVSALDVSIQAQILNLLQALQERFGLTYLFIVHDLAVAEHFCTRLGVLYLGSIMELADRDSVFSTPLHPYTRALLAAAPVPDPDAKTLRATPVSPSIAEEKTPSGGCKFRLRCPVGHHRDVCRQTAPDLIEELQGHWVACHFPGELAASESRLKSATA